MITGDHIARGGEAFFPGEAAPHTIAEDDGNDEAEDASTSAFPFAAEAIIASAVATASVAVTSSRVLTVSLSSHPTSTLVGDSIHPADKMDINTIKEIIDID